MATDPRRALAELAALERQLRELLRTDPLNAAAANALRLRLLSAGAHLAALSPPLAAHKELEQALWKPCCYRRIEDFRRRIRKYAAQAQSDRAVREHFARVCDEFQRFLEESAAFYAQLRDAFAGWLRTHRGHQDERKCRQSLHRCYVFLGDLARYRELHGQRARKNFAAAEALYHRALAVLPESGNPHNQLAVLATYVEAETVAVYRYCRSLLTKQPFTTAEENLALLFERSRQRPLAPPVTFSASPSSKEKSAFLKSYLHRLTRMHGILFALSSPRASPTASGRNSANEAAAPVYPRDMEALLFKDMRTLLRVGVIGDALLLKLVVTNIFCVIRAVKSSSPGAPVEDALRLALRTVTSVVEYLSECLDAKTKASVNGNGKATKDSTLSALRLLGPVTTFCEYLELHPAVLEELEQLLPTDDVAQESTSSLSVSSFLEATATLVNNARTRELYAPLLVGAGDEVPSTVREQQHLLKESLELRGFTPLERNGSADKWQDDWALQTSASASPVTPLADADAGRIRAWKMYHFARYLCDGYEGDPLLFCGATGKFTTAPTAGKGESQQDNGPSEAFAALNLGFLSSDSSNKQVQPPQPQEYASNAQRTGAMTAADDEDDDFEDEVIVFQPSPALRAMSGSQPMKQHGSYMANAPSPLDTLSNGGAFSLRAPSPISPAEEQGRMSTISQSSAFGDNGSIGSSLGYPSFNTFSDTGSFSGQGLLGGWGNTSSATSNGSMLGGNLGMGLGLGFGSSGADSQFMMPPSTAGFSSGKSFDFCRDAGPFAPMADLAAVERESARYQQRASSLSAFLGSATPASQSDMQDPSPPRAPTRPPPGFGGPSMGGQQSSLHSLLNP